VKEEIQAEREKAKKQSTPRTCMNLPQRRIQEVENVKRKEGTDNVGTNWALIAIKGFA